VAAACPLISIEAEFGFVSQGVTVYRHVYTKNGGEEVEGLRFYLTSLNSKEGGIATLARLSRRHWVVENNIHWVRDAVGKEDACRARSPRVACALALIRTTLIAPIRAAGFNSPTLAVESFAKDYGLAIRLIQNQRLTL
jgi:hypothetical protein